MRVVSESLSWMTDELQSILRPLMCLSRFPRLREYSVKWTLRLVAAFATLFSTLAQAADTLPPSAPMSLAAISRNCSSIDLTWIGSQEPEADEAQSGLLRYEIRTTTNKARVYSGTGEAGAIPWPYLQIPGAGPGRFARINGLQPGAVYEFTITAVDLAGNRSAARKFPIATVLSGAPQCADTTAPSAPTLEASALSALNCHEATGSIGAAMDAGSGIEGYFVHLDGVRTQFVAADSRRPYLRALTPRREYRVTVQAVDFAGNLSPMSAPAFLRMPECTAPVSGLLNVWVQAFYFKGESVPAYDHVALAQTVLHDADGANLANPLNVDHYLRESSYGKLGLNSPSVFVRWTQLPRTAAEYNCTFREGEFRGCNNIAISMDAATSHPLHETIARVFPLRVNFVDRFAGYSWSQGGPALVTLGMSSDAGAQSLRATPLILESLMQYTPLASSIYCSGPGTGAADGWGNVPKHAQDANFGCFAGADPSVRVDEASRRMPHPAGLWKFWNGWIPEAETMSITPPFSGFLGAVDRKHTLDKLLLIPMTPAGSGAAGAPTYSMEYVSGAGSNAGQQTGLVIRFFGDARPPGDNGTLKRVAILAPGESFVDPHRGIRIQLVQALGNVLAQVRVCNTAPGVAVDGSFSSVCVN